MSWDDEAEWDAPAAKSDGLTDMWAGEDADDDGGGLLGDDWDAEEKAPDPSKPEVVKKLSKRQLLKKKEEQEREAARKAVATRKMAGPQTEEDRAAIKKAIEDSNTALCDDLFGDEERPVGGEFKSQQLEDDNVDMIGDLATLNNLKIKKEEALEEFPLKMEADFKKFGEKVVEIASKKGNQKNLVAFLNAALEAATKGMKLDDCNTVKKHLNVICTKKQKDESNKKKKGGPKKATLNMNRNAYGDDDDYYDGGNDDGFM